MGDPKKLKKKYSTPYHPWEKARIDDEKKLLSSFGLKNKKEIWRMGSLLKKYQALAKKLVALKTKQAEIEKNNLLTKLQSYNLLKENADIHDVLDLKIADVLERRLQSILVKKGLARTPKQARQFITHGHVLVNGKRIDSPSYLVTVSELNTIEFNVNSSFIDEEHPERVVVEKIKKENETKN